MKIFRSVLLISLASVLLMYIAFYNGYPVLNSDAASYIHTGMYTGLFKGISKIIGTDRSPFYGWFIHYSSFKISLWYTIFFQCMILAYLLIKYVYLLQKSIPEINQTAISIIVVISLTCVSWISSYLMPDIFGGILLLAIILFMFTGNLNKFNLGFYLLIIFVCILIHNSHFLILLLFSISLLVISLLKRNKSILKKSILLISVSFLGWFTICAENVSQGNGFVFSKSSHIFFMARLCEMGILKSYLDDECGHKNLKLCKYKDSLPVFEWVFLWDSESPLYKTGGWDSSKTEYTYIIKDIISSPKYLPVIIRKSIIGTFRELGEINIADHFMNQGKNSECGYAITCFFPDEQNENIESLQNNNVLNTDKFNMVYMLFFLCSTVWILFNKKIIDKETYMIYSCIVLFFLINAFVTSTFATVADRFQNRIFWILPATNAILIVKYYFGKYRSFQ